MTRALKDVKSAIAFHIETFRSDAMKAGQSPGRG